MPTRPFIRYVVSLLIVGALLDGRPARGQESSGTSESGGADGERPIMTRYRPLWHRELLLYRLRGAGIDRPVDHVVRALLGAPLIRGDVVSFDVLVEYQNDHQYGPLGKALYGPDAGPAELHRFELAFPIHLSLNDRWGLEAGARVIYAGDLKHHDPRAWLPFGRVSAAYRFAEDWAFLFGLVSAQITDVGWLVLPILGIYYRPPDGEFHFDGFLPSRIEGRWWPFESLRDLHFFVGSYFRGIDWHVEEARVNRIRLDIGAGARWLIWHPLELEVRVGSNLMQFTSISPDDSSLNGDSWLDSPTFTFSAGVVVRTN